MHLRFLIAFNVFALACSCDWGSWSSCSARCGGGTKSRKGHCGTWWTEHSNTQKTECNEFCYNSGRYYSGRCNCPARYTGRCCESIKRCYQDNGGCVEKCIPNSHGSTCACKHSGYKLASDGRSCTDVNECNQHICSHNCRNTAGSYLCSCRSGYTLGPDKKSCIDNDECQADTVSCQQLCINTPGSFKCGCRNGYRLQSDGITCEDDDECNTSNGGCSHTCTNTLGSFDCSCPTGYVLAINRKLCQDVNECAAAPNRCQQICKNTQGSFTCHCRDGYTISSNGWTCDDIDDCIGVTCQHGGRCIDGVNSVSCSCLEGFAGNRCENGSVMALLMNGTVTGWYMEGFNENIHLKFISRPMVEMSPSSAGQWTYGVWIDFDECQGIFRGGCEDKCVNTFGSFRCVCTGNKTLAADGHLCDGGERNGSVFDQQHIHGLFLPRGCSTISLSSCSGVSNLPLLLSSTSPWYELVTDSCLRYTQGIVFVEINSFALPVSMTGAEVINGAYDVSLTSGSLKYNEKDGKPTGMTKRDPDKCWNFNMTARYIHDFLQSQSFLKTVFKNIEEGLPQWMSITTNGTELFGLHDMRTEFLHGHEIVTDAWCKGAPVLNDRLYSVLKLGETFSLKIYGDEVILPKPLQGEKFCFIVDICGDQGGTFFLMIPEDSRDFLEDFEIFKQLSKNQNLHIRPRGIGISLPGHVKVTMHSSELQLWNGDQLFNYKVFKDANLWIGGDVTLEYDPLFLHATADLYFKIPSFDSLLTSLFKNEWGLLMQTDLGADLRLKFRVFQTDIELKFKDIGIASFDVFASIGGQKERQWCGDGSNPPGFFFSAMAEVNPFQGVPILQDWVFDFTTRLYVFVTSDPESLTTTSGNMDILLDVLDVENALKRFRNLTKAVEDRYGNILPNKSLSVLSELDNSINSTLAIVSDQVDSLKGSVMNILNYDRVTSFDSVWSKYKRSISSDSERFGESVEHNATNFNFESLFQSELETVENSLKKTGENLSQQLLQEISNIKGFGFRFSADLKILGLKFGLCHIEVVYSIDHLGACGKFKDMFDLFENEKSLRVFGKVTVPYNLGPFLNMNVGGGIGIALGVDTSNFQARIHAEASMLGIRASSDLILNNNGLYFIVEGSLWSFFKAKLSVSATHEKYGKQEWDMLALRVHGELLADSDGDKDFNDSYLDALRKALQSLADAATKRLSEAQDALTNAQSGLTSAQNWLESKKENVRALDSKFDDAINVLEGAKNKLEEAKGPFRAAIAKLNAAQRKVDNICRIENCRKVCVPGIKCKICHKRGWFHSTISYPCCRSTSCGISFPDPICVAKNIACRAIRGLAYVALEAAKVFVRIPMLALDAAKLALSAAQFIVDKSRVVLDIAIAAIDVAKFALEGAKGVLEIAKLAIEGVKQVMKIGFNVLDMIIHYGIQTLIDLKNCQFDIELTTKDLPVFSVSCQINALRLGWRELKFGINFNRPFQSLWQAAKSAITIITDPLGNLPSGRKKRNLLHEGILRTHRAFRFARQINPELQLDDAQLNETIDIVFETAGYNNGTSGDDYENRVWVFKGKCERYNKTFSYLNDANTILYEIANETMTMLNSMAQMHEDIDELNVDELRTNFTLGNSGINPEVALRDYNITEEELTSALANASLTLDQDPVLRETSTMSNLSRDLIENSSLTLSNAQVINHWLLALSDVTTEFFSNKTCVSFLDCAHYCMTELLDIYYAEDFDNVSEIVDTLSNIEDTFLELVGNSSLPIQVVYNLTKTIGSLLHHLDDLNPVCSSAPVFLEPLTNVTVTERRNAHILCNVSGNPTPTIWWFADGEVMAGEHSITLQLANVSEAVNKSYTCVAGNVVANLSSDAIYLNMEDEILTDVENQIVAEHGEENNEGEESSEPISNHEADDKKVVKILGATITSVVVIMTIGGVSAWRVHVRKKFRKNNEMGSFLSMGMVRPVVANKAFSTPGSSRAMTPIDAPQ